MKSLIEMGDTGVAAVKTVYRAALNHKASGKLVDPGGERRVFYPHTAVRLRAPIPNPRQMFGMAGNHRRAEEEPANPARQANPGGQANPARPANPAGRRLREIWDARPTRRSPPFSSSQLPGSSVRTTRL